jgi:uncharacterized protein YoxC
VETLFFIVQIVLFLCLSALCVYLIVVLLRVRDVLANVEKDLKEMTSRALPVLDNMEFITSRVKSITENLDDQVMIVRESISSVKQVTDNIVDMERRVQERLEGPILETVAFVAAVFKGVRTFLERVRA